MPRKKLEKKLHEGEEVPTQAIVKEMDRKGGLVAYADFVAEGVQYKAGDVFEPPAGWEQDAAFQELIHTKSKPRGGVVFLSNDSKRVILPVEEA